MTNYKNTGILQRQDFTIGDLVRWKVDYSHEYHSEVGIVVDDEIMYFWVILPTGDVRYIIHYQLEKIVY